MVVVLALWAPWLLVPVAVAAAASSVYQARRLRGGYGSELGLPPGALRLVPVSPRTDRCFFEKQIVRHGPVSKTTVSWMRQPLVCVAGLDRGAALLRQHESRVNSLGMGFDPLIPAGFIRSMRPDDHRRYRRILGSALTDRTIEASVPFFAETARATFRDEWPAGASIDPRPALGRFTLTSFGRLFLGVMPGTEQHARIAELYLEPGPLYLLGGVEGPEGADLRSAAGEMSLLVRRRAAASLADGGADGVPSFLSELVAGRAGSIDDPNVVLNLVFLLANSSRDVAGLMHWLVKMLADNPGWAESVRAENGSGDLPRRIVSETLRLAQSEYIARRAVEEFELDGFVVPKGWYVRVCVGEAHRDPTVFPDPQRFDPDRFLGRRYGRNEFAPFGMLNHSCLGANATMRLAETLVRELCSRYDLTLERDGRVEHDGYHWRPSRRHRVSITPAADPPAHP